MTAQASNKAIPSVTYISAEEWKLDFLMDYIVQVHHHYLKKIFPILQTCLQELVAHQGRQYPELARLELHIASMSDEILLQLVREEKVSFPYIRQMESAYHYKEAYARLLVSTLSKPLEEVREHNERLMNKSLDHLRTLTQNYQPPVQASAAHRLHYTMLQELDHDLQEHLRLENGILLPRALAIEKEILRQPV
ncbi:MAG TPA: hemerythrin domain-containing protein [Puia sp.]|nr:hemerythrin domain-containing protein [Puia sp.]